MKKVFYSICFIAISFSISAQNYEVETTKFNLSDYKIEKGWKSYGSFVNNNGDYVIKFGSAYCDVDLSTSYTYDTKTIKANFKGVAYKFKEVVFGQNLQFKELISKDFPTTVDALQYQKDLFGKTFEPINANVFEKIAKNNPYAIIGKSITEGVAYMPKLTSDYIGQFIVFPVTKAAIGKPNNKISTAFIMSTVKGNLEVKGYYEKASCSEVPIYLPMEQIDTKENKNELWILANNVVYPGGGIIGYFTKDVVPDDGKLHVIYRQFDENLNELNRLDLPFDYTPVFQNFTYKNNDQYDMILIAQSSNKGAPHPAFSKMHKEKNPNQAELIYIDGKTLKVKHRIPFELPYSKWYKITMLTNNDNEVYFMGKCATDNKTAMNHIDWGDKGLDNFQILKFKNGKIDWIKGVDAKGDAAKIKLVTGEKIKGKSEKKIIIRTINPENANEVVFLDDKFYIQGQVFNGQSYVAEFNSNTGDLLNYYVKPESIKAKQNLVFSKDKKSIYWLTYNFKNYNKYDSKTGVLTSDKIPGMIAGELFVSKLGVGTGNFTPFTQLGKEEWLISYHEPVILDEYTADSFILYGRTIAKKAKNSELVLVKVKKN
ncbi:MAG: hypothetical protein ACK4IK_11390 [Bacteroidia bacterium]